MVAKEITPKSLFALNGRTFLLPVAFALFIIVQSAHSKPHFPPRNSLSSARGSHKVDDASHWKLAIHRKTRHPNSLRDVIGSKTNYNHSIRPKRNDSVIRLVAAVILRKKKRKKETKEATSTSQDRCFHIGRASVPEYIWQQLTGDEFYVPKVISSLAKSGVDICSSIRQGPTQWKPTKSTHHVLTSIAISDDNNSSNSRALLPYLLQHKDAVLVWTGKFKDGCHGCHLPCIKTRAIIPMPPKELALLLMDSTKVLLYNKMSLGRTDLQIITHGIDTFDGESKIVRNRTKPPLSSGRILEFHTFMHARKLLPLQEEGEGYIVVSRAVAQGYTSPHHHDAGVIPSEIILGANLLRSVQGEANKTDFTGVTHVNAPNVPLLLATKVGIKGAVDFINDIRSLCNK
jgi:hypothetical protein